MIFKKELREYQKNYLKEVVLDNLNDFILSAPCGTGKTAMALWLLAKRNQTTLIVVPTNFLKNQWIERIEFFTDLAKSEIKCIDSSKNIEFRTVTLITISMLSKIIEIEDFDQFNTVIFDEAHNLGADTYYPILNRLNAKYRIALSATMRRADGVHEILKYCFGKQYFLESPFPKCKLFYVNVSFEFSDFGFLTENQFKNLNPELFMQIDTTKNYYLVKQNYSLTKSWKQQNIQKAVENSLDLKKKPENYSILESIYCELPHVSESVSRIIEKCLKENRKILVLAKRTKILKNLYAIWSKKLGALFTQLVLGKQNKTDDYIPTYEINNDAKIIFGINQLAAEGLDADFLDTLILINPISDVEQAFGRIRRLKKGKNFPHVYLLHKCHFLLDKVGEFDEISSKNAECPIFLNKDLEMP